LNWGELPDLMAVALLACAFASVARRSPTPVSGIWLTGWIMIALHFAAFIFLNLPGALGTAAAITGLVTLTWAGLLFMWAAVPHRRVTSSYWMLGVFAGANALYITVLSATPTTLWALKLGAALLGAAPLLVALAALRRFNSRLRWTIVSLYVALSIFLLVFQNRPGNGADLALNGVLFTVFLGCCLNFWFMYNRSTTGAFITIAGFVAWAAVFVVAPLMAAYLPQVQIQSEVWNLPKYVVAVGMILLLLEDQIEHTRHLALHDYLTGLPNRRLFQDRLVKTLERARRSESKAALLVIDLDRFKKVNDSLGHHMGDLVLQQVAGMFSARVRRSDTVARTGGDEFSIIIEEPTDRERAMHLGMSLMEMLNEPMQLEGEQSVRVGASVGVAVFPEDASDMESLCIAADLRMYSSKHDTPESHKPSGHSKLSSLPSFEAKV
jgi:diguanylate cyclase (GGDEF)-like protein